MKNIDETRLKEINNDLIFFFLLIVASFSSFYIVINKKRELFGLNNIGRDNMNKIFQFSHYLLIFINIYFVINAYEALEKIKNDQNFNEEKYNTQLTVLVSNVLLLIASIMYLPIMNSEYVLTR